MDVSDIIDSVDILEYVSQYCDFEEKNGEYWALSPLKEENTPSFSINTEKQYFYDFSSGSGGNILSFIQKYHQCDFYKAIDILKKYANITEDVTINKRLTTTKVLKKFKKPKPRAHESKGVLLDSDYMSRYEFNTNKLQAWVDEGIPLEVLRNHGVMYDEFSDRIVYPIYNLNGDIINVSGRTLDPDYKAKKIRKYTYFKPLGDLDTIYWLYQNKDEILRKKEIILFEGAKSVMTAESWGITNSGAILTSHLNPLQLRILIKLGVKVVFALDEDVDIADDANIAKLKRFVKIEKIVNVDKLLSEKMSPVDMGKEVWQTLYERRVPVN